MSTIDDAVSLAVKTAFKPHNLRNEESPAIKATSNPKRILISGEGPGHVHGIVVPKHMWEGSKQVPGMREINEARAKVYGPENRDPLTVGKIADIHRQTLEDHFQKPLPQQLAAEDAALNRLRAAKHISKDADTLDASEKLDTVNHERDEKGRGYVGFGSKGVAGHAAYSSGVGDNQKFHVLNTCPGQTAGCGGGVDHNGIVDTKRGTCFAPNAESQYPGASVRRAAHAQAKHDPAMTKDWILAHTGSLRGLSNAADKQNKITLFRPNVVDETDKSSRYVIRHLNRQRKVAGKPPIIANSYGKTNELHDPKNGYFVTYSNAGPKTKLGQSIADNISRDKSRIHSTILAADASGRDFRNDDGDITPPKNSYMVTDVPRYSDLDAHVQKALRYAKYWSTGRPVKSLQPHELAEGPEGHFGAKGEPTTPEKAHYGHATLNGKRYDYQNQHILHPRMVQVGKNKDGSPHLIPTDSRFMDDKFLPKNRFMTKNGKKAGAIILTTPTTSTSGVGRQTSFTHHINEGHVARALKNNGEYEVDPPHEQEAATGKEYVPPREDRARGGLVHDHVPHDEEVNSAFPEIDSRAQMHNAHRAESVPKDRYEFNKGGAVDRAVRIAESRSDRRRG